MENTQSGKIYNPNRFEIIRLYLVEGWQREQVQSELEKRQSGSQTKLTWVADELRDQWNNLLQRQGIFKNLSEDEVILITNELRTAGGTWNCLVFASDVLLDNVEVERHYKRKGKSLQHTRTPHRRILTFIPLHFSCDSLSDPNIFKDFQRFLFYVRVHFESSFDSGTWKADHRGLYARTPELRAALTKLSDLHNKVCGALRQFREGRSDRAWALMRCSFWSHESIVESCHHRLFSDILAILLLLQREGHGQVQKEMIANLLDWAAEKLPRNDPRMIMFESLPKLVLDSTGHLYLAFDAYCRHLWMSRAGPDQVKSSYSYNQASLPRVIPGEFYNMYKGKRLEEIRSILQRVDWELGEYSHETLCLWHTAIRFLWGEERYGEIGELSQSLYVRLDLLGDEYDYSQQGQLNFDASLTLYLLGVAQEAQGRLDDAESTFFMSLRIRSKLVSDDIWEPLKVYALGKLEVLTTTRNDLSTASYYTGLLHKMYAAMEAKDKREQAKITAMERRFNLSRPDQLGAN
ncbi:hypothetical protein NFIA_113580 [Paecilomyces variotii No. 5]|uniref:Clr5 domain-containing protein n=1 Tax=Byssochlamys spectabilis (strain No. 5 / NBRC 109023) TaxID=1356009 RepID=V5FPB1_BYSSN|nr:hypothetical protein NFIA_113580 [Paecilomyces variotii No. 5]